MKTLTDIVLGRDAEAAFAIIEALATSTAKITVHGATVNMDGSMFTAEGVVRAVGRGFSEDVRNSGAGMASGVNSIQAEIMAKTGQERDDAYAGWAKYAGLTPDHLPESPAEWTAFTAACMLQIMRDKAADVYTGTVRQGGGGPRKTDEERFRDDETVARIAAALGDVDGKAFKAMGAKERAPILTVYYNANKAAIDTAVAARVAGISGAAKGLTLADLLAQGKK